MGVVRRRATHRRAVRRCSASSGTRRARGRLQTGWSSTTHSPITPSSSLYLCRQRCERDWIRHRAKHPHQWYPATDSSTSVTLSLPTLGSAGPETVVISQANTWETTYWDVANGTDVPAGAHVLFRECRRGSLRQQRSPGPRPASQPESRQHNVRPGLGLFLHLTAHPVFLPQIGWPRRASPT